MIKTNCDGTEVPAVRWIDGWKMGREVLKQMNTVAWLGGNSNSPAEELCLKLRGFREAQLALGECQGE
jgi:hypothetical protein